jgi:APA family basic amino acid/polyamine antiporter
MSPERSAGSSGEPAGGQGGGETLARELGAWDGALLTVGSVIGTGIFLVSSDIAKALPHGGALLAVWLLGGLLTVAGALTYAELGAMFPRAGGIYVFLRETYGPLPGFLYGWGSFLVIMSGGIAALAVGFGEYFGAFFPALGTGNVLAEQTIGGWTWRLTAGQLTAAAAIVVLTAINHVGVRAGAPTQNALTPRKNGAIQVFVLFGLFAPARAPLGLAEPFVSSGPLAALGLAMIAALWTYDGWYGLTFSAGEMRRPERDLPLGLIGGTALITLLYLLLNVVYLRALPIATIAESPRVAEAAAAALFGDAGGRLLAAAVLVSTFGCVASTILYSSRIYAPMAEDGVFFQGLAKVDERWRVPVRALWAQSLWAVALTLTGTYAQLYTYVVFGAVLFHVATAAGVFVLRARRPEAFRPYRVWGYPAVPILFILASLVLLVNTLFERPVESIAGLALLALGLPAYAYWRRRAGA